MMGMKMSKWKSGGARNEILSGDGYYVSYNGNPGGGIAMFAGDDGAETALNVGGNFYILNGDFRAEYEAAFDAGADAMLAVYAKHKAEHRSSWSEDAA